MKVSTISVRGGGDRVNGWESKACACHSKKEKQNTNRRARAEGANGGTTGANKQFGVKDNPATDGVKGFNWRRNE
eukprot:902235-Pleurochrysis_carterae.AAC.1